MCRDITNLFLETQFAISWLFQAIVNFVGIFPVFCGQYTFYPLNYSLKVVLSHIAVGLTSIEVMSIGLMSIGLVRRRTCEASDL